jgi:hypothetical protein
MGARASGVVGPVGADLPWGRPNRIGQIGSQRSVQRRFQPDGQRLVIEYAIDVDTLDECGLNIVRNCLEAPFKSCSGPMDPTPAHRGGVRSAYQLHSPALAEDSPVTAALMRNSQWVRSLLLLWD